MREFALHYFPADCFGIEREIVFGVTYVLSLHYSCAVVSVFCCGGKVNFVRIPYRHDRFSKISRTLFGFRNKKLLGYLILEKQLANFPDRGFLFLRNTLLLYSLSP